MLVFNTLYVVLMIVLSAMVPGVLLGFSLLKKTKLFWFEKLAISFLIGMFLPPFLSFIWNGFFGVPFSPLMVYANIIITTAAGLILCWKTRCFGRVYSTILERYRTRTGLNISAEGVTSVMKSPAFILLVLMFLAWYLRFQAWTPIYQELDPYFYVYGTKQLLTLGYKPVEDATAWYPLVRTSHRGSSLYHFMLGHWYYLHAQDYDKYLLTSTASMYPPIAIALLVFMAYLLMKTVYNERYGLFVAGLMTFLPATLLKASAGVFELQPLSLSLIFFFLAMLSMGIKYKKKSYHLLAGCAIAVQILGATAFQLSLIVLLLILTGCAVVWYLKNEDAEILSLLKRSGLTIAIVLFVVLLNALYSNMSFAGFIGSLRGPQFILSLMSILPLSILTALSRCKHTKDFDKVRRRLVVAAMFFIGLLMFFMPVFGDLLRTSIGSMVAQATYPTALWRTIQEQAPAGSTFEGYLGFMGVGYGGLSPGVPLNNKFGLITWVPSVIVNTMLTIIDKILSFLFNQPLLETTMKDNSLTLFFLFFAFIELVSQGYSAWKGKENRFFEVLLLSVFVFPVSYVGLNKAKYEVYLALSIVMAAAMSFAFIERALDPYLKRDRDKRFLKHVITGLLVLSVAFEFLPVVKSTISGYAILTASFTPRYQDDPELFVDRFGYLCNATQNPIFCQARHPEAFIRDINDQFNQLLCQYSLLPEPVIKGEREASLEEMHGISYRCSRIADYWIDSMEWISLNTPKGVRIISWWDYGHWINYFGDRNAVLRNEHSSLEMIGRTAYAYLHGTEDDLKKAMDDYYSDYALFDTELMFSGNGFGGKYGALNYLACDWSNKTDVTHYPGESECERSNVWETVYMPLSPSELDMCTVSLSTGLEGVVGSYGTLVRVQTQKGYELRAQLSTEKYCLVPTNTTVYMYRLDERDDKGNLLPHAGIPVATGNIYTVEGNPVLMMDIRYTYDTVEFPDGEQRISWEDRPVNLTHFYDSNLYKALVLNRLEGFEKVYDNGNVKIYRKQ